MVTFNRDGNIFVEDTGMDSFIRSGNYSYFSSSSADAATLTGPENVRIDSDGIYIGGMGTITNVVNAIKLEMKDCFTNSFGDINITRIIV
jgi:hypothetical protein